jgi:hypothetical protein
MCVRRCHYYRITALQNAAVRKFMAPADPGPREYSELADGLFTLVFIELRVPFVSKDACAACSKVLDKVQGSSDGQMKFQQVFSKIKGAEHPAAAHLLRYPEFRAMATHEWAVRVAR